MPKATLDSNKTSFSREAVRFCWTQQWATARPLLVCTASSKRGNRKGVVQAAGVCHWGRNQRAERTFEAAHENGPNSEQPNNQTNTQQTTTKQSKQTNERTNKQTNKQTNNNEASHSHFQHSTPTVRVALPSQSPPTTTATTTKTKTTTPTTPNNTQRHPTHTTNQLAGCRPNKPPHPLTPTHTHSHSLTLTHSLTPTTPTHAAVGGADSLTRFLTHSQSL